MIVVYVSVLDFAIQLWCLPFVQWYSSLDSTERMKMFEVADELTFIMDVCAVMPLCRYAGEGARPWKSVKCDIAIPCATQNELDVDDARALISNGCRYDNNDALLHV